MDIIIDNEYNRLSKILEYIENSEEDYSYLINRCKDIFEEKKKKMKEEIFALENLKKYLEKNIENEENLFLKNELENELKNLLEKIKKQKKIYKI
jgi:tRNA A37 N6-isopentenylltransferase MiaA